MRAHHASIKTTSLAASTATYWIQDGRSGIKGTEWSVAAVPGGQLPTHHNHWPLATSTIKCGYLWSSQNLHKFGWSIFHCCWSTSVEQSIESTTSSPWLLEFRWLLKTHLFGWWSQRLVTYLDIVHFTNILTYLLTYSLHPPTDGWLGWVGLGGWLNTISALTELDVE